MRILAVDVGTGTQDILLFDSERGPENCIQLVMPSPTVLVAERVRAATREGAPIVLTGVTMGGGPSAWAVEDHLRAGLAVYATPLAAQSFDDDLERVAAMGVRLVDESEAANAEGRRTIELRDYFHEPIVRALEAFGVEPRLDAIAVAVFDHGAAPPDESDRVFRFRYLADTLGRNPRLTSLAYRRETIPPILTRALSVARTVPPEYPLVVMDTGAAAALGALEDPRVRENDSVIVVNAGNYHALAFHLEEGRAVGLFEHHTGELGADQMVSLIERLANGSITNQEVFGSKGHGAFAWNRRIGVPSFIAVTGPRRSLLRDTRLNTYMAVPYGDMMLTGCFGLLRAVAAHMPEHAAAIDAGLSGGTGAMW